MVESRFDSLTRELVAHLGSRRNVFRAVTAGIAGAVFGSLGFIGTEAKKKKRKKKCKQQIGRRSACQIRRAALPEPI